MGATSQPPVHQPPDPAGELVEAPPRGLKFWLRKLVTAAISFALLGYVLYGADWRHIGQLLGQLHAGWLLASIATVPIMVGVSVWKWQILLSARSYRPGFGTLLRFYITGQFYNYLLPTSSGGDVVRTVLLHRQIKNARIALGSIIVERFTGLAVLIITVFIAAPMLPGLGDDPWLLGTAAAGTLMACAVMLLTVSRRLTRLADRLTGRFGPVRKILAKARGFQDSLWAYRQYPRVMAAVMVLSGCFYVAAVLGAWFACLAFGEHVSLGSQFIIVPMVLIITLLPITLGGIGLWEWAFASGFTAAGLPGALGLSVSLMLRLRDMLWSAGGYALVVVLTTGRSNRTAPRSDAPLT